MQVLGFSRSSARADLPRRVAVVALLAAVCAHGTSPSAAAPPPPLAIAAPIVVGAPSVPAYLTGRPGDTTATLWWIAPADNGSPITGYKITPVIGTTVGATRVFKSTAQFETLSGLTNGTTYRFRVAAVNARGTGRYRTSPPITVGAPVAPTGAGAVPARGAATVSWLAPTSNASPITGYIVTPYVDGVPRPARLFSSTAGIEVISGLSSHYTYTFKIAATNAFGTGPQSAASNSVTIG